MSNGNCESLWVGNGGENNIYGYWVRLVGRGKGASLWISITFEWDHLLGSDAVSLEAPFSDSDSWWPEVGT